MPCPTSAMDLIDLFKTVITSPPGYFCLAAADKQFNWKEHWYRWPEDQDQIVSQAHLLAQQYNVYWSSHLFDQPRSLKSNVLPTRTIQVDLDEADAFNFSIQPTVIVQTSERRYQGYWVLQDSTNLQKDELERLSRKLTYAIPQADRSSWTLGHRLRLPETYNYKYDIPHPVTIISTGIKRVDLAEIEILPDINENEARLGDEEIEWISKPHEDLSDKIPPQELIVALCRENLISQKARLQYSKKQDDRSGALWLLMQECFAAGLDRDTVYWLAHESANNKWLEKSDRDLRKDVLRAERKRGLRVNNLRMQLHEIRNDKTYGPVDARLDRISDLIIKELRSKGRFYHSRDGECYYCETELGIPGMLYSESWATKCTLEYGINSSTTDYRYVTAEIAAAVRSIESRTEISSLSYFDQSARTVLLHSGGKDVYVIKPDSVSNMPNGSTDVLFEVNDVTEPFMLDYRTELPRKWYELLFSSSLEYVDGMDQKQALALITCWFMYIILRKGYITRPLLGMIGQPGSGKSVLGNIIYKILYGRNRSLHQITNEDDYDLIASKYPLIIYDNLDDLDQNRNNWIVNRLATSIEETTIQKRRLYTDMGVVTLRRAAMVALTSHDPKFIRADIADRLIFLNFKRRDHFTDEYVILGTLAKFRNAVWAAIVEDIQLILKTPKPDDSDVPDYRVKDFATGGTWIARALGIEEDFVNAIKRNKSKQSNTVLEQEALLVSTLEKYAEKNLDNEYSSVTKIWADIVQGGMTTEQTNFQRVYRNSVQFGNKLFILHHNLKEQLDISFKLHEKNGSRLWRIKPKGSVNA